MCSFEMKENKQVVTYTSCLKLQIFNPFQLFKNWIKFLIIYFTQ